MPEYPAAHRSDAADVLHGVTVADPYRWLEDPTDPQTATWSEAQDALCSEHLSTLASRAGFAARLEELIPGSISPPAVRGGLQFFRRREPGQDHDVLFVRDEAGERVLVDPNGRSADGLVTLDAVSVSPDGARVAYQLSEGGDEESVLRILEVSTGDDIDGPIDRCRYSPVAWEADGGAIFYMRYLSAAEAPDDEPHLHRRVFRHVVGADDADDELIAGAECRRGTYWGIDLSEDDRWLVLSSAVGTAPRTDVWLVDRKDDPQTLRPIQVGVDARTHAWVRDDRLWIQTDRDAPNGRFAVADLESPTEWTDLIAHDDLAVLDDASLVDDAIIATWKRDVAAEIEIYERDGSHRHSVALAGRGTASVSAPRSGTTAHVRYADFAQPGLILRVDATTGTSDTWATTPGFEPVAGIAASQVFVESLDGTRVPMSVVRPDGSTSPGPTILSGYGGFNVALEPEYSSAIVAWVEAGGTYAVANLRGGSEYGERWHRDGMREHKHHVFEDFEACADWLVAEGVTTNEQLGISGGSNGGLLVGAAVTRDPSRYAAVVCSAPLLDMIRYERFGLGETWNDEYGRADDPTEFEWLISYSPYHRVVEGVAYPATMFTLFDSDTRVDPMHGRKLCAAMQWATSARFDESPIILRRESDVGHGARSISRTIGLAADRLAFLAGRLGLGR